MKNNDPLLGIDVLKSREKRAKAKEMKRENSKICFIAGPMRAGKSKMLIDLIFDSCGEKRGNVLAFTSNLVVKEGESALLHTRADGGTVHASIFDANTNFLDTFELMKTCSSQESGLYTFSLYIDEGHFLTVEQVSQLAKLSLYTEVKEVNVSGLVYNYMGGVFPASEALMEKYAAFIILENANCEICEAKNMATKNIRVDNKGNRILSGDVVCIDEQYKSVCEKCFNEGLQ